MTEVAAPRFGLVLDCAEVRHAPGSTTVEVVLTPVGDETELRLRQSGLPAGVAADEHAEGWGLFIGERLAAAVAGRQGAR
jgi:Activator of Hsp90 ATPase homolog 1-like protein